MTQPLHEIRRLLDAHGIDPRRGLGQCFLHDRHHLDTVVAAADAGPAEAVLEVGPGTGSLSEALLATGAPLVAVEADERLRPLLEQRLGDAGGRLRLLFDDVLAGKHRIAPAVLEAIAEAGPAFQLVANLPYRIASPLLLNLLRERLPMRQAVVMVQREVADRILAEPGRKAYGPLGIMAQALAAPERIASVPPTAFWPEPRVHSAVVRLRPRGEPAVHPEALARLTHRLFSQRRKTLRRILGAGMPWPEGVSPAARPETLTVSQIVALARRLEDEAPSEPAMGGASDGGAPGS